MEELKFSLSDYDYVFPKELIAQTPLEDRSSSRLMILDRKTGEFIHSVFSHITEMINKGDCLVVNDTKVIPANLDGRSEKSGAAIGILVLDHIKDNIWDVIMKNSKRVDEGGYVIFDDGIKLKVLKKKGKLVEAEFNFGPKELVEKLWRLGTMPLPPYIKEDIKNLKHRNRYQTVYAKIEGARAAPTAGLHFTNEIMGTLKEKGVHFAPVTLHVGLGTFESVSAEDIREHKMHSEYYEISGESAEIINRTKSSGGRVIAVGTTSMRVLESVSDDAGKVSAMRGSTDKYIYPGYRFKIVDCMITNFHLPRTSLLVLVSAFAGYAAIRRAYAEAIMEKYRLFSYGDSMFIK
jgi:S-adenosylmethionine:tRNA ribosyltransferase-isomerase